jgi:hypothetical protein
MNYLSELFFGKKTEDWENIPEPKNLEKYCLSYCPYKYINSGMAHPLYSSDQALGWKIEGIKNNETYYSSTFPDFNEKIFDTEHYEQVINNLEQKYTEKAFNNKQNIEIIKRIKPHFFNYEDKEYDFSRYEFIVTITKNT